MQDIFDQFTVMPAITVTVFLLIQALKSIFPSLNRFLPAISGGLGLIIALLCKLFMPQALPNDDLLIALACGAVSGFAATGAHQLKKTIRTDSDGSNMNDSDMNGSGACDFSAESTIKEEEK